jgi:hypothetical protein
MRWNLLVQLLRVLALDRFSDYSGDRVMSPVPINTLSPQP